MVEMWKHPSFETLQKWVDAILNEASDELNDWESTFVEDMRIKVLNEWRLTESQAKKLESIYSEKTS